MANPRASSQAGHLTALNMADRSIRLEAPAGGGVYSLALKKRACCVGLTPHPGPLPVEGRGRTICCVFKIIPFAGRRMSLQLRTRGQPYETEPVFPRNLSVSPSPLNGERAG